MKNRAHIPLRLGAVLACLALGIMLFSLIAAFLAQLGYPPGEAVISGAVMAILFACYFAWTKLGDYFSRHLKK